MPLDSWLNDRLALLESAYKSGNLGALNDVVFYCNEYKKPLPEWAVIEITKTLYGLSIGNGKPPKSWAAWFKTYKQDMADFENYDNVIDAREHGATLKEAYDIASILTNGFEKSIHATRDAYLKVSKRIKTDEKYRYLLLRTFPSGKSKHIHKKLWIFIKNTIKSIKRNINKNIDL